MDSSLFNRGFPTNPILAWGFVICLFAIVEAIALVGIGVYWWFW